MVISISAEELSSLLGCRLCRHGKFSVLGRIVLQAKFPTRTGVTSVVVYAPTLFKIAGFSPHKVGCPSRASDQKVPSNFGWILTVRSPHRMSESRDYGVHSSGHIHDR